MKRIIVYCEGPTEETFVNRILEPELRGKGLYLTASSCGGVSKYSIIKKDLIGWCKSDPTCMITTMLDFYGIPSQTPGLKTGAQGDLYDYVEQVEECIKKDIGADNLIPNLTLHEFEALLFSNPQCFDICDISKGQVKQLCETRVKFAGPELVNNSPQTAPSKRIQAVYPAYNKIIDGYNVAKAIGLQTIRKECPHFDSWVKKLEYFA